MNGIRHEKSADYIGAEPNYYFYFAPRAMPMTVRWIVTLPSGTPSSLQKRPSSR